MNTLRTVHRPNAGLSLIELLVSMAITLVLAIAATTVYLGVRETDATQSMLTEGAETGTFALQMLGRDISQAGFYPVVMPPASIYHPNGRVMETYPPTNWTAPNPVYLSGIYGCEGGTFQPSTATCASSTVTPPYREPPDSLVINYFTSDALSMTRDSSVGNRHDCTGSDAGNDATNSNRQRNTGTTFIGTATVPIPATLTAGLPPYLPLFVSNRYALSPITTEVDKQSINTFNLSCSGNGSNNYQPLLVGIEDLQVTYGVFDIPADGSSLQLAPAQFYTANGVAALTDQTFETKTYHPWDRVTAVRLCIMTRTLGGAARIKNSDAGNPSQDKRTYLDCKDETPQAYLASDNSIRKRHIQVFAVRNRFTQSY